MKWSLCYEINPYKVNRGIKVYGTVYILWASHSWLASQSVLLSLFTTFVAYFPCTERNIWILLHLNSLTFRLCECDNMMVMSLFIHLLLLYTWQLCAINHGNTSNAAYSKPISNRYSYEWNHSSHTSVVQQAHYSPYSVSLSVLTSGSLYYKPN